MYRSALHIALTYAAIAALWILLSDLALSLSPSDAPLSFRLSVLKGWGFVLVTALLLYALLRRHADLVLKAERAYRDGVEKAEEQKRQFFRNTIAATTGGKLVVGDLSDVDAVPGPAQGEIAVCSPRDGALARDAVRRAAIAFGLPEARADDLEGAAGEAITNLIKHANGGVVTLHEGDGRFLVRVADSGPGIADLMLPRAVLERGYSTKPSLGMGYTLMLALADRIYLSTGPAGTTVILEMLRQPVDPLTAALHGHAHPNPAALPSSGLSMGQGVDGPMGEPPAMTH